MSSVFCVTCATGETILLLIKGHQSVSAGWYAVCVCVSMCGCVCVYVWLCECVWDPMERVAVNHGPWDEIGLFYRRWTTTAFIYLLLQMSKYKTIHL